MVVGMTFEGSSRIAVEVGSGIGREAGVTGGSWIRMKMLKSHPKPKIPYVTRCPTLP